MFHTAIGITIIVNAILNIFVIVRQVCKLRNSKAEDVKDIYSPEDFTKAVSYSISKCWYNVFLLIYSGMSTWFLLKRFPAFYSDFIKGLPYSEVITLVCYMLANAIAELPADFYYDFILENIHGFNNKTFSVFFSDFVTNSIVVTIMTITVGQLSIRLVEMNIAHFWAIWWVCLTIFTVIFALVHPNWIVPLYNTLTPLPPSSLRTSIVELAVRAGFDCSQILVLDSSKRSDHSNAYFAGFGKAKKIILYDTILRQLSEQETVAVLAHELGHWKHGHTYYLIGITSGIMLCLTYLFNLFVSCAEIPTSLKLIYFIVLSSGVNLPLSLIRNVIIRSFERQADRYAVSFGCGADLRDALIKIGVKNKAHPVYDPIYSAVHNSHPSVPERIQLIAEEMNKIK